MLNLWQPVVFLVLVRNSVWQSRVRLSGPRGRACHSDDGDRIAL